MYYECDLKKKSDPQYVNLDLKMGPASYQKLPIK